MAGLGLRDEVEHGSPGGMGSRPGGLLPRKSVQTAADAQLEEPVPRGVILHLVDAMAEAVVGVQNGLVAVGLVPPFEDLGAPHPLAELGRLGYGPPRLLARQGRAQHRIGGKGVVILQRGRLVEDFVRCHGPRVSAAAGCATGFRPLIRLPDAEACPGSGRHAPP